MNVFVYMFEPKTGYFKQTSGKIICQRKGNIEPLSNIN